MSAPCALALSIVSHGHDELLATLLSDLAAARQGSHAGIEVIITENIPGRAESLAADVGLHCRVVRNSQPKGFGANHNAAFALTAAPYFGVLNPDLRISDGATFSILIEALQRHPGVAGPRVIGPGGEVEDSARRVPTPHRLLERVVFGRRRADYGGDKGIDQVDWLAGMCLLFDRATYEMLGGFDERYFLYCEDVDICLRAHLVGRSVSWVKQATVMHDARRKSLRSKQHFAWHLASLAKLMTSSVYRRYLRGSI